MAIREQLDDWKATVTSKDGWAELEEYFLQYLESFEDPAPVYYYESEISRSRPDAKVRKVLSPQQVAGIRDDLFLNSLIPWADNHVADRDSGIKARLKYNPYRYPEQRLTQYITNAKLHDIAPKAVILNAPKAIFRAKAEEKLTKALGSEAAAQKMIADFQKLAEELKWYLDNGRNAALGAGHADLRDIGFADGAAAAALGDPRYVYDNFYTYVNKLMAIEADIKEDRVTPLTSQLRAGTNIAWSIPPTGVRDLWNISTTAYALVNGGSDRILSDIKKDPENGLLLGLALQFARMLRQKDEDGNLIGLAFPAKADHPETALEGIEATAPFGFWVDPETSEIRSHVGEFIVRQVVNEKPEDNKSYFDRVLRANKIIMENLSGLPVDDNLANSA